MAANWTPQQKRAIDIDGCNVLVSAAAGSGKTAVLVERIISRITAKDSGTDIDKLVVVTFTKAAAAQMKQRIRQSLDSLIETCEDEEYKDRLLRQLTLVNNAQITTIDSFCLNIIRNNFVDIDIDPGFRTADAGEIELIENDVMSQMLEDYYDEGSEDFFTFVDSYGTGRDDSAIEEIIHKAYSLARSYPWPEEWFESCKSMYDCSDVKAADNNVAVKYLMDYVKNALMDYDDIYTRLESICNSPGGPSPYLDAIQSDHIVINMIIGADSFERMAKLFDNFSFTSLAKISSKNSDIIAEKKEYVKAQRDAFKKFMTGLTKKIFISSPEAMIKDVADNAPAISMLMKLALDFSRRLSAEKKSRNVIDFNDMEHMALDVLVKRENGVSVYTAVSDNLSEYYDEILIDEYQDSNLLQDVILGAVSKGKYDKARNNIYMVGDVKQSIYRFRLACPQLFIDKYNQYTSKDSECTRIELQTNFRSRYNVLESTNDVFKRAMNPEYTGVSYDDKARLNTGLKYPDNMEEDGSAIIKGSMFDQAPVEIILSDSKGNDKEGEEELDSREREAGLIADRIKKLMSPDENGLYSLVYDDKAIGSYRRIRLSDIVVLTRTVKGWADTIVDVLMHNDIPAYSDASQGYFNVREINLLLNYLAVIDNPLQDIPMAAVMLSYFGRFNTDELAAIRLISRKMKLYQAMRMIIEKKEIKNAASAEALNNINETLREKVELFLEKLDKYREMSAVMPISQLIWNVVYDTGYYDYVGTMPAGMRRQANVDILIDKAASYEQTSYTGLFNFLRYIDRLKKFNVDIGEASILGENEDLVRVMSIHKSKGLEFPVVIVAGMGKEMNLRDASGSIVTDADLGVGTSVVRLGKRTKTPTLIKAAISRKIIAESISEELRVLYVAMTRAREKLIMTGCVSGLDKKCDTWQERAIDLVDTGMYSYAKTAALKTYLDVVMPVAMLEKKDNLGDFHIIIDQADEIGEESDNTATPDKVKTIDTAEIIEDIHNNREIEVPPYRYDQLTVQKSKITVSELKKMQHDADMNQKIMEAFDMDEIHDASEESEVHEIERIIPEFIAGRKEKLAGNERGTAYHRVMECLDYNMTDSIDAIKKCMDSMLESEKITTAQLESVDPEDILKFCKSDIGMRVAKAYADKTIRREQPFVFTDMEIPVEDGQDRQLIQGIIDLYIREDDEITIVDYKTDRVRSADELVDRYSVQLDYYAKAIEQVTGKHVKEKIIYSFQLGKQISV